MCTFYKKLWNGLYLQAKLFNKVFAGLSKPRFPVCLTALLCQNLAFLRKDTNKKVFFLVVGPLRFYPPYTNGLVVRGVYPPYALFFLCVSSLIQTYIYIYIIIIKRRKTSFSYHILSTHFVVVFICHFSSISSNFTSIPHFTFIEIMHQLHNIMQTTK